jgi:hypothetical protein
MAAKERKERKGLGDFKFWSRSPGLTATAITALQKGRSRCRDIGMSRYVAGPLKAGWNASDQVYDVNFAFLGAPSTA